MTRSKCGFLYSCWKRYTSHLTGMCRCRWALASVVLWWCNKKKSWLLYSTRFSKWDACLGRRRSKVMMRNFFVAEADTLSTSLSSIYAYIVCILTRFRFTLAGCWFKSNSSGATKFTRLLIPSSDGASNSSLIPVKFIYFCLSLSTRDAQFSRDRAPAKHHTANAVVGPISIPVSIFKRRTKSGT